MEPLGVLDLHPRSLECPPKSVSVSHGDAKSTNHASKAKVEESKPHLKFNFKGGTFSSIFLSDAPFGSFANHDPLQEPFLMFLTHGDDKSTNHASKAKVEES